MQELVEAEECDHIAAEAADVMYFMLVRCIAGGIGLADIERHLDRRALKVTRRPGNAKEWRSEKAAALLGDWQNKKKDSDDATYATYARNRQQKHIKF